MNTTKNRREIYVFCPSKVITGGAELLHQLCDSLNNKGHQSYMIYHPDYELDVPLPYRSYNVKVLKTVKDVPQNVLILPEAFIDLGYQFKSLKKVHWWLSVDNFFVLSLSFISPLVYLKLWPKLFLRSIGNKVKYFFDNLKSSRTVLLSYKYISDPCIINAVQSKYAFEFLKRHNFKNVFFLSDYINSFFFDTSASVRENVILYNPKKGIEFTKTLIAKFPDFKWTAIENMTYDQVNALMAKSKLYVDFGNHPGKDRMPREAVLSGMCIITGRQGSAAYFEDVTILDKYKFDESKIDVDDFEKLVNSIFDNFDIEYSNFLEYRMLIENSKQVFEDEVDNLIKMLN